MCAMPDKQQAVSTLLAGAFFAVAAVGAGIAAVWAMVGRALGRTFERDHAVTPGTKEAEAV